MSFDTGPSSLTPRLNQLHTRQSPNRLPPGTGVSVFTPPLVLTAQFNQPHTYKAGPARGSRSGPRTGKSRGQWTVAQLRPGCSPACSRGGPEVMMAAGRAVRVGIVRPPGATGGGVDTNPGIEEAVEEVTDAHD